MNIPYWFIKHLPYFDYICPKCKKEVKKNSHKCVHCGERYGVPLRVPPYVLKEILKGNAKPAEEYVHKHVFPRVSEFERNYLTKYFTEIFSDGFDDGTFNAWTGTLIESNNTLTVVSDIQHHGTYSAKSHIDTSSAISSQAQAYKQFTAQTTLFFRYYFRASAFPTVSGQKVGISDAFEAGGHNPQCNITLIGPTNMIVRYRNGGDTIIGSEFAHGMSINTWYCIEGKVIIGVGTGEVRLYIEGDEKWNVTGLTNNDKPLTEIRVGGRKEYTQDQSFDFWYDCVVVADAYIGPEEEVTPTYSHGDGLTWSVYANSWKSRFPKLNPKLLGKYPNLIY